MIGRTFTPDAKHAEKIGKEFFAAREGGERLRKEIEWEKAGKCGEQREKVGKAKWRMTEFQSPKEIRNLKSEWDSLPRPLFLAATPATPLQLA